MILNFIATTAPDVASPTIWHNIAELLRQVVELLGGPSEVFQKFENWINYTLEFVGGILGLLFNLVAIIPPVFGVVFTAMLVISVIFIIVKLVLGFL